MSFKSFILSICGRKCFQACPKPVVVAYIYGMLYVTLARSIARVLCMCVCVCVCVHVCVCECHLLFLYSCVICGIITIIQHYGVKMIILEET